MYQLYGIVNGLKFCWLVVELLQFEVQVHRRGTIINTLDNNYFLSNIRDRLFDKGSKSCDFVLHPSCARIKHKWYKLFFNFVTKTKIPPLQNSQ